jgi:hypothetical protein
MEHVCRLLDALGNHIGHQNSFGLDDFQIKLEFLTVISGIQRRGMCTNTQQRQKTGYESMVLGMDKGNTIIVPYANGFKMLA